MSRPSLFVLRDVLIWGGIGLLITALALLLTIYGNLDPQASAIFWVMAISSWAPYLVSLVKRIKFVRSIAFITKDGLAVIPGNFTVPQEEVERVTEDVLTRWKKATGVHGADLLKGYVVFFRPFPLTDAGGTLAGFTLPGDKHIHIGLNSAVSSSALAHELGHVIYGNWKGKFENPECHAFMSANGLP